MGQSLPQGRAPIVPVPNAQPCKPTHQSMIQTEQVILKNLYVYAYTCVMALNEKRDREFGREQGEIYGRVQREERKGGKRCNYLIISKRKEKSIFLKEGNWMGEMIQWAKMLAAKLEDLSSVPRTTW